MTSTPSPSAVELPSTPPAPRFGAYFDNWEPYQPRKSARIASQSKSTASSRTPSPTSNRKLQSNHSRSAKPSTASSNAKARSSKASESHVTRSSRISNTMKPTDESGSVRDGKASASSAGFSSTMLPTPTKTPRKPTTAKQTAEMDSVSRNIFPTKNPELTTRSGRTSKKISGSTLESFIAEDPDQDFTIFSDSCNRIPQKDESNPFYNARASKPTKSHKKRQVKIPGEGMESIERAAGRTDGMLMKFRGKTVYRPLAKQSNEDDEELDGLADELDSPTHQSHATRKATARILFPKETPQESLDAEEEVTDVEDMTMVESDSAPPTPNTPPRARKTPNAPKFPNSPPATQRTTRSADKLGAPSTPSSATRHAQPKLNYNSWGSVAKSRKSAVPASKRSGDHIPESDAKRTRA